MKIYIDANMPFAEQMFAGIGEIVFIDGRNVTAADIKDADVLLVRSVTRVDEALLAQNDKIRFVGTATIGTDHIDKDYLHRRGIQFVSAPGCNKISVAEYILSALLAIAENSWIDLTEKSIGIIGAGNTGSCLYQRLSALGLKCYLYDPPLERLGDPREFSALGQVLAADIISLHVPLTRSGSDATYHLINEQVLSGLLPQQILINTSRGEVIDNQALLNRMQQGGGPKLIMDVWEGEPNIEQKLVPYVDIATPHIAGYSLDGKARGTEMLYEALCLSLSLMAKHKVVLFLPTPIIDYIKLKSDLGQGLIKSLVHLVYDVRRDDQAFRAKIGQPGSFDQIRKNYRERRELSTLNVSLTPGNEQSLLQSLGFTVQD